MQILTQHKLVMITLMAVLGCLSLFYVAFHQSISTNISKSPMPMSSEQHQMAMMDPNTEQDHEHNQHISEVTESNHRIVNALLTMGGMGCH